MQAICGHTGAMQTASEFTREENVAKLRATICFHGTEAFRQLQIVEFQRSALMRGRCGVDDPSRCRGHEAFAQFLRHDKISHMIERERKFEPVLGKSAAGEHGSRVIDPATRFISGMRARSA